MYFIISNVDYNLFWGEASFDDRHCPLPFIVPGLGLREKRPGTGVYRNSRFHQLFQPLSLVCVSSGQRRAGGASPFAGRLFSIFNE